MAKLLALSLSLCFLLLGSSFAFREQAERNECQLQRLNALQPDNRIESEGGLIETWNPNNNQFQCAGVALSRCTLQRNGLRRPFYSNAPQEIFIEQGTGIFGMIFPGCPETFEEPQESERQESRRTQPDSHQKVHRFREGDVIAVPTGVAFWMYNDQDTPVVAVSFIDSSSSQNQLDQMPRRFYLAGSQEQEFLQYQHQRQSPRGGRRQGRKGEQENEGGNIFNGFSKEFLEDAFNVNRDIVNNLQAENEDEERGGIVTVKEGLRVITPPSRQQRRQHGRRSEEEEGRREEDQERGRREEDQERGRREDEDEDEEEEEEQEERSPRRQSRRSQPCRGKRCSSRSERENGIEETICSVRLRHNIGRHSSSPDIYNPEAGSIKTTTSLDFPALFWLRLSAEYGTLYNNAMFVPHYNLNANSVLYALRGRAHIQVVNCNGETVFDEELEAGRALVVPQNFAVAARSRSDRFAYVSFKTNDRPMIQTLAGGSSLIRGLPEEVVAETFNLRREQASQLKNNNPFRFLVPPRESQRRDVA